MAHGGGGVGRIDEPGVDGGVGWGGLSSGREGFR